MRSIVYALVVITAVSVTALASRSAISSGQSGALVRLQPTSPGSAQTGNSNVSGTIKGGNFLAIHPAAVPVYQAFTAGGTLSALDPFDLFSPASAEFVGATGVIGASPADAFLGAGVVGVANNPSGTGVHGFAASDTGVNIGVQGSVQSAEGFAGFFNGGRGTFTSGLLVNTTGQSTAAIQLDGNTGNRIGLQGSAFAGHYGIGVVNGLLQLYSNGVGSDIGFGYGSSGNFTERMRIKGDGSVGIGVNPASKLHVSGTVTSGGGLVRFSNGGANPTWNTSFRFGAISESQGVAQAAVGSAGWANSSGASSYGAYGIATGTGGINYGVYGTTSGLAAVNYAGYFNGTLFATSASAGVKAFLIDHPDDPENMLLEHSSIESDERMNLYRGEATTDEKGYATVTVPNWFAALNKNIQYQLTVVDDGSDSEDFVLVRVAQRLKHNSFKIRTSRGGVAVNWQITGERDDPTARHFPLRIERQKSESDRGKYLVPEAYGFGNERAMNPNPTVRSSNKAP